MKIDTRKRSDGTLKPDPAGSMVPLDYEATFSPREYRRLCSRRWLEMWDIYEKDNTVFFYRIGRGEVVFTVTFENTQGSWTVQRAEVVDWFDRRNSDAVNDLDLVIRVMVLGKKTSRLALPPCEHASDDK